MNRNLKSRHKRYSSEIYLVCMYLCLFPMSYVNQKSAMSIMMHMKNRLIKMNASMLLTVHGLVLTMENSTQQANWGKDGYDAILQIASKTKIMCQHLSCNKNIYLFIKRLLAGSSSTKLNFVILLTEAVIFSGLVKLPKDPINFRKI